MRIVGQLLPAIAKSRYGSCVQRTLFAQAAAARTCPASERFRPCYRRCSASTQIPVLEQVVNFSQARHGVLAGNIANLDTPGYRVRDLSPELFQERLKAAIQAKNTPPVSCRLRSQVRP